MLPTSIDSNIYTGDTSMTIFSTYVYAYCNTDGKHYYIGQGSYDRVFRRSTKDDLIPNNKSQIKILGSMLTKEEELLLEYCYIYKYGRQNNNTDILLNKTSGTSITKSNYILSKDPLDLDLNAEGLRRYSSTHDLLNQTVMYLNEDASSCKYNIKLIQSLKDQLIDISENLKYINTNSLRYKKRYRALII